MKCVSRYTLQAAHSAARQSGTGEERSDSPLLAHSAYKYMNIVIQKHKNAGKFAGYGHDITAGLDTTPSNVEYRDKVTKIVLYQRNIVHRFMTYINVNIL